MVTHLIPSKDSAIACGGWYTLTCDIMNIKDGSEDAGSEDGSEDDKRQNQWMPMEDFPCPTGNCENAKFG